MQHLYDLGLDFRAANCYQLHWEKSEKHVFEIIIVKFPHSDHYMVVMSVNVLVLRKYTLKYEVFRRKMTLESALDYKEIKPVNPKGNQPRIIIGRTDAEAEALVLWPSDMNNLVIGKEPDAGKDWGQEERGATEDEMVGWHHWLGGHEFEQTLGDSEGQESLLWFSPWGHKESDMT